LRQRQLNQTAQTSDWIIYPKLNKRSLKSPEIQHTDQQLKPDSNGFEVFPNSGIPNKAFYEVAMKLGTDDATAIWIKAISQFTEKRPKFAEFARETATQAEKLSGNEAQNVVREAWRSVGVQFKDPK
jgi:Zn-dependent metalloprotease